MKFNLLLLMWLAMMAGFAPQTAQAAAASPETQVTLKESLREVRAKGRRVLLRDDKPKKERSALLRIFNIIGAVLVIGSLIVVFLFMIEGFLFYSPTLFLPLLYATSAAMVLAGVLYGVSQFLEWLEENSRQKEAASD